MWVELWADAGIRNNVFTTDKNCMQERIADKTADMGFTMVMSVTVFYCLEGSPCITIPKNWCWQFIFSNIMCPSLYVCVCMSGRFAFQHILQDACFWTGGSVPNSAKLTSLTRTECPRNIYAAHINDMMWSNPASCRHSVLDFRFLRHWLMSQWYCILLW